jgi:hypothetical protein
MIRYRLDPDNPRRLTPEEARRLDAAPIDYSDIPPLFQDDAMTDDRPVDQLPESIKAELRAANAKHIATCDGPNGSVIEFWAAARGGLLPVQRYPDGNGFDLFRPFDKSNSIAALIEPLHAYLAPDP